jgi:Lar family restriction alleviation protein
MTTTNQRAVELAPCPFCGGPASLNNSQVDEDANEYWVICEGCGAVVSNSQNGCHADEEAAITAWNRRAPGWRPISEAPRDGSQFLGWFEGSTVQIWWMGQGGLWGNDFWEGKEPTHFMPLPPPPGK